MRQVTHGPSIRTQVLSFGLLTVLISLPQPSSPISAQELTGMVSDKIGDTGIPAQRIEKFETNRPYLTNIVEKKDAQTLSRTQHRLIRKQQKVSVASVEPSPPGSTPVSSLPTAPSLAQSGNSTPQTTELSSLNKNVGAVVPLASISVTPAFATTQGSTAGALTSTGTIQLAAPGNGKDNSSTSRSGHTGGRSMGRLTAEMPGLAQLISPPSDPVVSANPAIGASPTSLSFTAQAGTNPAAQTLSISNTGGGTLSWSASEATPWLTVNPASGTGNGTVTVNVTTATLTVGTQTGSVTLTATGATPVTIPVTFAITAAPVPPSIGASPTALSFSATQGSANPAAQTLSIHNTGGGTLNWSASENVAWLTLSPGTGTGTGSVTLTAATGTLTAGSYSGAVTLSGGTGVSLVTVPVTFTVAAAPNIALNPSNLTYTATQGAANPTNQTVSLATSGGTLNWTVSDSAAWLSVSPASGSSSSTLTTAVNTTGLTAGTYHGTITVSATGSSSKTVAITLTVSAPASSSATLTWTPNSDSDLAGYKIYRATASGAYGAALATVPAGTAAYQVTGLSTNTTYFFVVTAYDSVGNESLFSNEVSKQIF